MFEASKREETTELRPISDNETTADIQGYARSSVHILDQLLPHCCRVAFPIVPLHHRRPTSRDQRLAGELALGVRSPRLDLEVGEVDNVNRLGLIGHSVVVGVGAAAAMVEVRRRSAGSPLVILVLRAALEYRPDGLERDV